MVAAAAAAIARTRIIMPASHVFAPGFACHGPGVLFVTFLITAPSAVRSDRSYHPVRILATGGLV
jgi:hypothetical protein